MSGFGLERLREIVGGGFVVDGSRFDAIVTGEGEGWFEFITPMIPFMEFRVRSINDAYTGLRYDPDIALLALPVRDRVCAMRAALMAADAIIPVKAYIGGVDNNLYFEAYFADDAVRGFDAERFAGMLAGFSAVVDYFRGILRRHRCERALDELMGTFAATFGELVEKWSARGGSLEVLREQVVKVLGREAARQLLEDVLDKKQGVGVRL